jgi:hypothetical protein
VKLYEYLESAHGMIDCIETTVDYILKLITYVAKYVDAKK